MVESLKELNRICQKPRYKEVGNWLVRTILRDAALPITWLFLHTRITANQVTLISLLVGLLGVCFFALPSAACFFIGVLLLQLWYLLDHVDGQIARYYGTASLTGRFFDFMTHHLMHGVIFFSLGFYAFAETGHFIYVLWGFLASIAMMMFNLIHDTKYKTFFEKLYLMKTVTLAEEKVSDETIEVSKGRDSLKKVFSFLHKICEIHVLMNILTVASIFQFLTKESFDFRIFLFGIYGLIVPVMAIVKISYLITRGKIDEEYQSLIR